MSYRNLKLFLLASSTITCLGSGINESWKELNNYELQRENFKTIEKKIEYASTGFAKGILYGTVYITFSPFIISGCIITYIHNLKK